MSLVGGLGWGKCRVFWALGLLVVAWGWRLGWVSPGLIPRYESLRDSLGTNGAFLLGG